MPLALVAIISSLALSALVTLLFLFVALALSPAYPRVTTSAAKWNIAAVGFIALVAVLRMLDITFIVEQLNTIAVIGAALSAISIGQFSIKAKPHLVVKLSAYTTLISIALVSSVTLFSAIFENLSPGRAELNSTIYCKRSGFGMVASESGYEIEVLKMYFLFQRRIAYLHYSDTSPEGYAPATRGETLELFEQCQRALKEKGKK